MPAAWQERLARMRQTVDGKFADNVRFVPMHKSQYGGVTADPNRAAFDGMGLLVIATGETANPAGSRESTWSARMAVGKAELRIDASKYPNARILAQGDHIHATDRGERFEINRIDFGQRARLVFILTKLGP